MDADNLEVYEELYEEMNKEGIDMLKCCKSAYLTFYPFVIARRNPLCASDGDSRRLSTGRQDWE